MFIDLESVRIHAGACMIVMVPVAVIIYHHHYEHTVVVVSVHSVGGSIRGGGGSGGCCGVSMHGICKQVHTWCVTNQVWRSEDNLSEPVIFHHPVGLRPSAGQKVVYPLGYLTVP